MTTKENQLEPTTSESISSGGNNSVNPHSSQIESTTADNLRHYPISQQQVITSTGPATGINRSSNNEYPLANLSEQPVVDFSSSSSPSNRPENNLSNYPLANVNLESVPLTTVNEKQQFRKRLSQHYPIKFVLFTALAILFCNLTVLYFEVSTNQLRYFVYNVYVVSKYAVITSLSNNLYALLAIISSMILTDLIYIFLILYPF